MTYLPHAFVGFEEQVIRRALVRVEFRVVFRPLFVKVEEICTRGKTGQERPTTEQHQHCIRQATTAAWMG